MKNPIRMMAVADVIGAALSLGMSGGAAKGAMLIKPGRVDNPFSTECARNAGNKSAGGYFYTGRGGRPCNQRKAKRYKKTLRYVY